MCLANSFFTSNLSAGPFLKVLSNPLPDLHPSDSIGHCPIPSFLSSGENMCVYLYMCVCKYIFVSSLKYKLCESRDIIRLVELYFSC